MSTLLKTLIEKRASTWEQGKSLLDSVEAESRDLSAEENEQWDRINSELSDLDKRIADLDEIEQRNRQADEVRSRYAEAADEQRTTDEQEADAALLRQIARGEKRGHTFTGPGNADKRTLTRVSTDGAELVPTSFLDQLQEHLVASSAIRRAGAQVLTTDSGESLQVPKTASYSSAAIIGEGSTITPSDPQFAQVTLGAFKYAFLVQVSSELLEDSAIDLVSFLARQGGAALGRGSDADFVNGAGSTTAPQGVVGASTLGKTGATSVSGAFNFDDLIDLFYSVIEPYRVNASWLMRDASLAAARKIKDTNTGQYIWQPGMIAGQPDTILGRPVFSDPNVPAVATNAKSVVFGDLSAYMIRDVRGVRVERSDGFAFDDDLVTFRFILRTDGDLIDTTGAVKHFAGGGS